MDSREREEQRKQEQAKKREEIIKRFRSGEPPQTLNELGFAIVANRVTRPRIVTCPQGVVSYTIAPQANPNIGSVLQRLFKPEDIDNKIRDILAASPGLTLAKLRKFGRAMGISIHDFEKANPADEDVTF